ncbi:MAG: hypothetical protein QM760_19400 [Nibricoccus sp.]
MKSLRSLLAAGLAACFLTIAAFAGDPSGTWKWSQPGRDGQSVESSLTLELKEEKLTGTLKGRMGDSPISDASFKDDTVTFAVVRERNGNKFTSKYSGKIDGDTLKGTIEIPGRDGGEARKIDWSATRAK